MTDHLWTAHPGIIQSIIITLTVTFCIPKAIDRFQHIDSRLYEPLATNKRMSLNHRPPESKAPGSMAARWPAFWLRAILIIFHHQPLLPASRRPHSKSVVHWDSSSQSPLGIQTGCSKCPNGRQKRRAVNLVGKISLQAHGVGIQKLLSFYRQQYRRCVAGAFQVSNNAISSRILS